MKDGTAPPACISMVTERGSPGERSGEVGEQRSFIPFPFSLGLNSLRFIQRDYLGWGHAHQKKKKKKKRRKGTMWVPQLLHSPGGLAELLSGPPLCLSSAVPPRLNTPRRAADDPLQRARCSAVHKPGTCCLRRVS